MMEQAQDEAAEVYGKEIKKGGIKGDELQMAKGIFLSLNEKPEEQVKMIKEAKIKAEQQDARRPGPRGRG